jgi:hypothetical protein
MKMRKIRFAFIVVAAFYSVAAPHVRGQTVSSTDGRWKLVASPESVIGRLELIWPDGSTWRRPIPVTAFSGISSTELVAGSGRPVQFRYDEDAGGFAFTGSVHTPAGTGTFHFTPKRSFASSLESAGIAKASEISDRDLMNLAFGGFSEQSIHQFAELGFTGLNKEQMMDLAVQQVTPDYVASLRKLGVKGMDTVREVVDMKMFGITPDYVRGLASAGIRGLTGRQLVDLHRNGGTTAR